MNVIRPGKRDQQIDVQESNHDSLCVQRVLDQLDCDRGGIGVDIEDWKTRSRLCLATWRETAAGEIRKSLPDVLTFRRGHTSRSLQHIVIDFQRRSHRNIIAS